VVASDQVEDVEGRSGWFEDDGEPVPKSVRDTLEASGLPAPGRRRAAEELWKEALESAAERADEAAAERLIWLTTALYDPSLELGSQQREEQAAMRAAVDSVTKVVSSARHHQLLAGLMSRAASRAGELTEAEAWLAACDPTSDEHECRASQRLAAAVLATRRGDLAAVQSLLGRSTRELPATRRYAAELALFAANALERSGKVSQAAALILGVSTTFGNDCARAVVRIAKAYERAGLELCPHGRRLGQLQYARATITRGFHWSNAWAMPVAVSTALLLVGLVGLFTKTESGPHVTGFALLALAASLWVRQVSRREARLRAYGAPSVARLQSVIPTSGETRQSLEYKLTLRVLVKEQWVSIKLNRLVHPRHAARFSAGAALPVRVDESNPRRLTFELD
jgi:hypothetical protein